MTNVLKRAGLPSALDSGDSIDSMEEEEAQSIVLTLQRSLNEELLMLTLYRIKDSLNNDELLKGLLSRNIEKHITRILDVCSSSTEIQKVGLKLMEILMKLSPDVCNEFQCSDIAYRVLLKALENFSGDEELQETGLQIFCLLLESENLRNNLLVDDIFETVLDCSLVAMQMYNHNTAIQCSSCAVLRYILLEDGDILDTFVEERLESFIKNLKEFLSEASVLPTMFKVLEVVARSEGHLQCLMSHDVDKFVMDAFHSTSADLRVIEAACDLLMELKKESSVLETLSSVNFLSGTLVPLMSSHPYSSSVIAAGVELFCLFCQNEFAERTEEEESRLSKQWCEILFNAMRKLMNHKKVQILSCKAVVELLKVCPRAHSEIGENIINNKPQSPLHSMCVGNILMYKTDTEVFACACEALYWLAADNERICENLMEKNAHIVVLDGIRRHFVYGSVVECGLRGLRAMIIFQYFL